MPIKVYTSAQAGAPALTGQVGTLLAVLDACLVDGYGPIAVTSLTRAGAVATLTAAAGHGLASGDSIALSGAEQAEYTGEFIVTVLSPTVLTFAVSGTPASPATGTLTAKRAAAGFSVPFVGANLKVYRSNDPSSRRHYFQITDDGTPYLAAGGRFASVQGFEKMVSLASKQGGFPSLSSSWPAGNYLFKSTTADATARQWLLLTDGKTVYLRVGVGLAAGDFSLSGYLYWLAFGDLASQDAYASFAAGSDTQSTTTTTSHSYLFTPAGTTSPTLYALNAQLSLARGASGANQGTFGEVGSNESSKATVIGHGLPQVVMGRSGFIRWPTPDGKVLATPLRVFSGSSYTRTRYRGRLPGMYEPWHGAGFGGIGDLVRLPGENGKTFLQVNLGYTGDRGSVLVDVTGPWD